MSYKKYLKDSIFRMKCQLNSIRYISWLPILVLYIILPFLIYNLYLRYEVSQELYSWIIRLYQIFAPFLSIWWPLIISNELIEGEGREVLYITKKIKVKMFIVYMLLYLLMLFLPFVVFNIFLENMLFEYFRIAIECFFYCGVCYALLYMLQSVAVSFMLMLLYTFFATYSDTGAEHFWIYFDTIPISKDILINSYMPLAILGIFFWVMGVFLNKRTEHID